MPARAGVRRRDPAAGAHGRPWPAPAGAARRCAVPSRPTTRPGACAPRADQILVTQGALHGWDLLLRTLTRPGDRVLLESPGYPAVARRRGRPPGAGRPDRRLADGLGPLGRTASPRCLRQPCSPTSRPTTRTRPGYHASTAAAARAARRAAAHDLRRRRRDVPRPDPRRGRPAAAAAGLPRQLGPGHHPGLAQQERLGRPAGRLDPCVARPRTPHRHRPHQPGPPARPVIEQLVAVQVLRKVRPRCSLERHAPLRQRRARLMAALATFAPDWQPIPAERRPGDVGRPRARARAAPCWPTPAGPMAYGSRPAPASPIGGTHDRFLRLPYTLPEDQLVAAVEGLAAAAASVVGRSSRVRSTTPLVWTA